MRQLLIIGFLIIFFSALILFFKNSENGITIDRNKNKIASHLLQKDSSKKQRNLIINDGAKIETLKLLPPVYKNYRIYLFQDPSKRFIDKVSIQNESKIDLNELSNIWKSLEENPKISQDLKDKLLVDLKAQNITKNQIDSITDILLIDSTITKENIKKLLPKDIKQDDFGIGLKKLYKYAKDSQLGEVYGTYIKKHVIYRLKNSTFFENVSEVIITNSDKYLDPITAKKIKEHLKSIARK
jgi:hypothetical protein